MVNTAATPHFEWELKQMLISEQEFLPRTEFCKSRTNPQQEQIGATESPNEKSYCKTRLKQPLKKKAKIIFLKNDYRWMQVKSIAECSNWEHSAILSTFIKHLSLISLFCLFLSGSLRQVLLYFPKFSFNIEVWLTYGRRLVLARLVL